MNPHIDNQQNNLDIKKGPKLTSFLFRSGLFRISVPRLPDMLFFITFFAVILLGQRMINIDGDIFRHLSIGRLVIETGKPITIDVFSHTVAGTPFSPHEWFAGVLFFLVYSAGKVNGLVFLSALLLSSTFFIVYSLAVSLSCNRVFSFILTVLGILASSLHWIIRPHLFSMMFTAIWLGLFLDRSTNKKWSILWFPALMLLWVNTHGEFVFAFLVLVSFIAGEIWRKTFGGDSSDRFTMIDYLKISVITFFASLINPVGIQVWQTILGYVGNDYMVSHTLEYQSPNFLEPKFAIFLFMIGLSIFLLSIRRNPIEPALGFLLAGITMMTLVSARNIHLYGVIVPVILAACFDGSPVSKIFLWFEKLFAKFDDNKVTFFWPLSTVVLIGSLLAGGAIGENNKFAHTFFPIDAVAWLEQNPQEGNVFNYFDWGGYLIYHLWPEKTVFIDPQTDVYGEKVMRQYEQVLMGKEGWQKIIDQYQIQWAILPSKTLIGPLLEQEGWTAVYSDEIATIYSEK